MVLLQPGRRLCYHRPQGPVGGHAQDLVAKAREWLPSSVTPWSREWLCTWRRPRCCHISQESTPQCNFTVVTQLRYIVSLCGRRPSRAIVKTHNEMVSYCHFIVSLSSVTLQPSAAFLGARAQSLVCATSGLALSSLAVPKHRLALWPGTESHCSQYNGEHSFAFRVRLGPGMFILLLLPEGNVDTVSLGDGNELLGNLAFPAHPHTDDLGRLPVRRGGREAASCTAH